MKTQLNPELAFIHNDCIRALTHAVLKACPNCFWTMPAATSGKYHPEFALGEGGLIRHTKATVHIALHLLNMRGTSTRDDLHNLTVAACILHDCCKKADHEEHTAFDHPLRAAALIRACEKHIRADLRHTPYTNQLAEAVASHMGRWNLSPYSIGATPLPLPRTILQDLVHTADFLASRKDLIPTDLA